jgi:DNA-binding NarL/FixJ family response regulator
MKYYLEIIKENLKEYKRPNLFTKSEDMILRLIGTEGLTNKEIADILDISVRTVETHRMNIVKKVGVCGAKFVLFAKDYADRSIVQ